MAGSTSTFDALAQHYGFGPARKAAAWADLGTARIGPEDPEAVRVLLHHVAVEDGIRFREAAEALRRNLADDVANASKLATANLAETADRQVRASVASMKASQAKAAAEAASGIADAADRALARKVRTFDRNTLAGVAITAVVLAGLVGLGGYYIGRADTQGVATELAPIVSGAQGPAWVRLLASNDVAASMARYCRPGSPSVGMLDGGRVCNVPLWIDRSGMAPTATGAGLELRRVPDAVADWLGTWNPLLVLLAGFMAATLGRKLVRGFFTWLPLRWVLDLGPVPETPPADLSGIKGMR